MKQVDYPGVASDQYQKVAASLSPAFSFYEHLIFQLSYNWLNFVPSTPKRTPGQESNQFQLLLRVKAPTKHKLVGEKRLEIFCKTDYREVAKRP